MKFSGKIATFTKPQTVSLHCKRKTSVSSPKKRTGYNSAKILKSPNQNGAFNYMQP